MNFLNRIVRSLITRTKYSLLDFLRITSTFWPTSLYLKVRYLICFGKKLDLENPKRFSEKIQWLKVNNILPKYSDYADKFKAKEIAGNIIGFQHIIPLLGVWEDADDVDFDSLPERFVLKCNHNSGKGMIICKDKTKLDIAKARKELKAGLEEKFHLMAKEFQYRKIKPLIIAEQFMEESGRDDLTDYKFFCFNGKVKLIEVIADRNSNSPAYNYYDTQWNLLPIRTLKFPSNPQKKIERPEVLDEMIEIAEKLSKGFPHVRIDLYVINGIIYFGEFTFTHSGGFNMFIPEEWELKIGDWFKLPTALSV